MFMFVQNTRSSWRFNGIRVFGLKTVQGLFDLLEMTFGMVWILLSGASVGRVEVCGVCGEWV